MEIKVMQNVLKANEMYADEIKKMLAKHNVKMYNLIGSPGAGKTSVLEKILPLLKAKGVKVAVIEGDCSTTKDAERIAAVGTDVIQINTGAACHLDANLINKALLDINFQNFDIIFVENVGNLVCPAEFEIGEKAKIAIISTTEGDEKPAKYPLLFHEADFVILTKTDLIPYTNFDMKRFKENVYSIKSKHRIYELSCTKDKDFSEIVQEFIGRN